MFSEEQKKALTAKLESRHVKERSQGGRTFSYIEGWHAIAEANRIFGFDKWMRETVECRCAYEGSYTNNNREMYRCTYVAKVRIQVDADNGFPVVREGTGAGHGFSSNPGDAHESAVKEAETDAMKRALMTFGNPFGLALYDKEQVGVENGDAAYFEQIKALLESASDADELKAIWTEFWNHRTRVSAEQLKELTEAKDTRKLAFEPAAA